MLFGFSQTKLQLTSQPFLEDPRKLIFLEWLKEEMRDSQSHFHLMNS
jgi:hypothetical protein